MPEMPGVPEMPFGSQAPAMEAGPKPGQGVTGEVIVSMARIALGRATPVTDGPVGACASRPCDSAEREQ